MSENRKVNVHSEPSRMEVSPEAVAPRVDIYTVEDGTTYLLAEVPGAAPDSVDLRVDKGVLTIAAEASGAKVDDCYARTYVGFTNGPYFRAFALSDEVDRDKIEASLSDGVLTVKLPRAASARTRKIHVKGE